VSVDNSAKLKILLLSIGERPIAFHRIYAKIGGSIHAGIFLAQAAYWSNKKDDGWFWKTQEQWAEETCLDRQQQERSRRALQRIGVLEESREGVPALLYYRVRFDVLSRLIEEFDGSGTTFKDEVLEPENDAKPSSGTTFIKDSETLSPETTPQTIQVSEVSDSQPQTPLRTRTCSKCRAYVPEDDLREHERGCVGKRKNKREAKAFRQAEAILNLKPASEVRPHSEAGAKLFLELRTLYKAKTGKKLGRLYGEALTKWQTAYQKHGPELLEAAFMDWREGEGNTPWMREQNQPIWHFLKDVDGLVAEAGARPEEERNAPSEIKDISRILREGEK
jgi:hypothetical protein